jgi:hypothetical protein
MPGTCAARVAPAATGHDPQVDRLGCAISTPPSTPRSARATAPTLANSGGERDRKEYLLAELRCAALRARLAACDIDTIGIALRAGIIDTDTAVQWLHGCAALDYVVPTPPAGGTP